MNKNTAKLFLYIKERQFFRQTEAEGINHCTTCIIRNVERNKKKLKKFEYDYKQTTAGNFTSISEYYIKHLITT